AGAHESRALAGGGGRAVSVSFTEAVRDDGMEVIRHPVRLAFRLAIQEAMTSGDMGSVERLRGELRHAQAMRNPVRRASAATLPSRRPVSSVRASRDADPDREVAAYLLT